MSWYNKFKDGDSKKSASSFWYDDYSASYDYLDQYSDLDSDTLKAFKKTNDLYKLSATRRAIANFVQIVTQKNIPVTYASKSNSMTDGKEVILSADVDDNFDVSVGLALHEGSHILLSDFKLLEEMGRVFDSVYWTYNKARYENGLAKDNGTPIVWTDEKVLETITQNISQFKYNKGFSEMYLPTGKIGSKGRITKEVKDLIGGLTNWIEDRRIDYHIFTSAPGYRDYYTSMYDHYFNDKVVTKGVASDEFTDEDFESYMFRIINLHNEKTDLNKLKGLRTIYRMINLNDIKRLKSTDDAFMLSIDVVAEILKYVPMGGEGDMNKEQSSDGESNGEKDEESTEGQGGGGEAGDEKNDEQGGMNASSEGIEGEQSDSDSNSDSAPTAGDAKGKDTMSKSAQQQLAKKFKKQKDFLNNDIKKKKLQKTEIDKLNNIADSDTELVRVGSDYEDQYGNKIGKGVDCIVVKNLTDSLINDEEFPFSSLDWKTKEAQRWAENEVRKGVTLGTLLGKKLQVRNESRETIYSRLTKGKIDGRMIASLGYDNENVFYTRDVDQYKKANLHISIDYSGSMSGDKLRRAITSTVAIVKACEMARNINVQVSIRSTDSGHRSLPYIAVVYDSRKSNFKQFCKYMSILRANNTTPEGLCFEAIQKQLIPSNNDSDSYFLNFSDGEPCYSINNGGDDIYYRGEAAAKHTRKQVKKMQDAGINTLSYFISEYSNERVKQTSSWRIFEQCYGKGAKAVNVENMFEVAKTMNELFLAK
jgi:hypothetical protein